MSNAALVLVAEEISALALKSPEKADMAIMAIADQDGDELALKLIAEMEPAVLAGIVRAFDQSKPSFLGLLSEPQDVINVFAADPGTWTNDKERQEILEEMSTLITSLILPRKENEGWMKELFELLAENDQALHYLAVPFIACGGPITDAKEEEDEEDSEDPKNEHEDFDENDPEAVMDVSAPARIRFPEPHDIDGEIGEIFRLMEEYEPDLAKEFLELIVAETKGFAMHIPLMDSLKEEAENVQIEEAAEDMFDLP